jgi:hypothetical protein
MTSTTRMFWFRMAMGLGIYCLGVGFVAAVFLGRLDLGVLFPVGATLLWVGSILEKKI